jgi:hypothetical protein
LTNDEIIKEIAGADVTDGSCASVAMAYIGQKNGIDVHDFRGGKSAETFRDWNNLTAITKINGIKVYHAKGASSITVGSRLLQNVVEGKEYYFVAGGHAAIVRKNSDGILQYLELQAGDTMAKWNYFDGWQPFEGGVYGKDIKSTLYHRFGCRTESNSWHEKLDFIIDIDESNFNTDEIKSILGYINTDVDMQKKGSGGGIK